MMAYLTEGKAFPLFDGVSLEILHSFGVSFESCSLLAILVRFGRSVHQAAGT